MIVQVIGIFLMLTIGVVIIVKPSSFMYLGDILRLKGKREYTSYATTMARVFGILLTMVSIFALADVYSDFTMKYEVTFNIEGNTSVYNPVLIPEGESIDLTQYEPIKEGYVFMGWTELDYFLVSKGFIVNTYVENTYIPTEDIELTAIFIEETDE